MESVIQTGDLDGYYNNKTNLSFCGEIHKTGIREKSEKKAVVVVVISLHISLNLVWLWTIIDLANNRQINQRPNYVLQLRKYRIFFTRENVTYLKLWQKVRFLHLYAISSQEGWNLNRNSLKIQNYVNPLKLISERDESWKFINFSW